MNFTLFQNYINTCSENSLNKFYVYELWDPIKNEVFYVGKGYYRRRYYRYIEHIKEAIGIKKTNSKNPHKINRIKSILSQGKEPLIKIVFESPVEQEAFNKEKELISHYGRRDLHTGSLTNLTDGGDGQSGRIYTADQRKAICLRMKGRGNPMYGKTHTLEVKKRISKLKKSRPIYHHTERWKNYLRSNESYLKKFSTAKSRPVYQISFEGKVINEFPSIAEAARKINTSRSNILMACRIKHYSMKGYYWRFTTDPDVADGLLINIDKLNRLRIK